MALRTAHGAGANAGVRVETLPVDELPALNAQDTARGLAAAERRGRPFERGNRAAAGRRPALATVCGMPLDATDPEYKKALGWARRYRGRRVRELTVQHGGELSAGVCAMITSSALDMAASRYLGARAALTGDPALMLTASRLAQSSRQQELTALEVAQREAAAKPKAPIDYAAHFGALAEGTK
jgi:hypothetical protein